MEVPFALGMFGLICFWRNPWKKKEKRAVFIRFFVRLRWQEPRWEVENGKIVKPRNFSKMKLLFYRLSFLRWLETPAIMEWGYLIDQLKHYNKFAVWLKARLTASKTLLCIRIDRVPDACSRPKTIRINI